MNTPDWRALSEAVKQRRRQLRLPQDLTAQGGPGEMTVRRIEKAEATAIRNKTKTQLEHALSWPFGYADQVLGGSGPADHLASDARELAEALAEGRGTDGLEVIYGGAYTDPAAQAALLEATAGVLCGMSKSDR